MNDRDWVGEVANYLQQTFQRLCETPGTFRAAGDVRLNPPLTLEEAKFFLLGLESELFRIDEQGYVQSEFLARPERNFRQALSQLFAFSPPPRIVRESVCQLATVSALVLQRGWLPSQIKIEPDEAASYGVDLIIESGAGKILICVEIKRSLHELQKFTSDFRQCCKRGEHAKADCAFQQNHGMFEFCSRSQPTYLWAVAPGCDVCFKLSYANEAIELEELDALPPRSHIEFGLSQAPLA
jgi:hypothetical protein